MTTKAAPLACAFGTSHGDHYAPPIGTGLGCLWCAAEGDRLEAEFAAAVASGQYDAAGYTPAERRAQAKRASGQGVR